MPNFCSKCGQPLNAGAKFCGNCGYAIPDEPINQQQQTLKQQPAPKQQSIQQPQHPIQQSPDPMQQRVVPHIKSAQALSEVVREHNLSGNGELAIDLVSGNISKIKSPSSIIGALFGGLGNVLTGPFKMLTNIKALIFTVVISALWIWLRVFVDDVDDSTLTKILSILTYAKGGTFGNTINVIGEFLGKTLVAGGLCSLLYSGFPKIGRGIKDIFTRKGFNIGSFLIGMSVSMACVKFFAGEQGVDGIMVGICGAMIALQAVSQKSGFIYSIAAAFSRKKQNNSVSLHFPQYKSLLVGGTLGFTLMSVLGAAKIYLTNNMYWVFLGVFVIGLVISLATRGKAGETA